MTLPAWRSMLQGLSEAAVEDDPDFVDWISAEMMFGRVVDAALRRHWVDPMAIPLEAAVIAPSHGVLITSATLTDPTMEDPFELARLKTGVARLPAPAKLTRVESPFDYASQARVVLVGHRHSPRRRAADGGGDARAVSRIRRWRPSACSRR